MAEAVEELEELALGLFGDTSDVGGDITAFLDELGVDRLTGGHGVIIPVPSSIRHREGF